VPWRYSPEVIEELATHGFAPRPDTDPQLVRDALSELYRYEIRALKARLLACEFPQGDYKSHVIALRRRYVLLSIPLQIWTLPPDA
jgi:hypothetical protein